MSKSRIAFMARAAEFSPNSVGKDMAILSAVRRQLQQMGHTCADIVLEDMPVEMDHADAYVSMGRRQDTLNWLGDFERVGTPVVNSTASVMLCNMRSTMMRAFEETDIPVPPLLGGDGYWVKRGYGCAESPLDVQYAPDHEAALRMSGEMTARGILDVEIRAHVPGDLVKCYAVSGTDFFRYYYPGDDGDWKFADESRNGRPQHYVFSVADLRSMLQTAARMIQLDVYGADCIIRPDGTFVLIDLNDWPSFSRCREEAAVAIAQRINQRIKDGI